MHNDIHELKDGGAIYNILFLDIETSPSLGWVWAKWQTNVIEFQKEWYMLSFAYKWAHEKEIKVCALPDYPLYKKDPEDDRELALALWDLLDKADMVVAHNGDEFDLKKINTRLLAAKITPPSPYRSLDTLKILRMKFGFLSNKLNDIAQFLGLGHKESTGGHKLWLDCIAKVPSAWETMKTYNKQDVWLLEQIYIILRPWYDLHPNVTLGSGKDYLCPVCGSSRVVRRGWRNLKSFRAKRYLCMNPRCGKWSTGKRERIPGELLH